MRYDKESAKVIISPDELAGYAFRRENAALLSDRLGFIKSVTTSGESAHPDHSLTEEERVGAAIADVVNSYSAHIDTTHTEIFLSKDMTLGGADITVAGLSDIISYDGVLHTVENVRPVKKVTSDHSPLGDPENFARACILAYIHAGETGAERIRVRLTYISKATGERVSYTALFSLSYLEKTFQTLLSRAEPFIKDCADSATVLPDEIDAMPFPYSSIRDGQEKFVKAAYRAIKRGEDLLVCAPTGIGKTMSALFPAVKSLAAGSADRIFYLTAKTVTGRAALDAAEKLTALAPHLRAVMILSKEMTCPLDKKFGAPGVLSDCFTCERMNTVFNENAHSFLSYRERELNALTFLLSCGETVFFPEIIRKTADEYSVCPYELSLDLSEYCGIIVCDYNYVTDDNVRFRRYFKDERRGEKYVFLFDEAHNLPDRMRNTYSAVVTLDSAKELFSVIESEYPDKGKLYDAAVMYVRALEEIRSACTESEYIMQTDGKDIPCGYLEDTALPPALSQSVVSLVKQLAAAMRDPDTAQIFTKYYKDLYKLSNVLPFFSDGFRFFCSREGDKLTAEVLCIDPSAILDEMLAPAVSSVMFSATLTPPEYFLSVLGMEGADMLDLDSPYERENLCLVSYDSVSTRLNDRRDTVDEIAEIILASVSAKEGNYIVYFPSYDYMKNVCRAFARIADDCALVMQKQGMSYRERQRFIDVFRERRGGTTVGFCVLGGMFSEGIDLTGESLIGVVIVGCGMPQLSAERNIMAAYYDEKAERGKDFAYTCPGMNRVLQAAGRVIRSENDRGITVIIDDRLASPEVKMMFPSHWRHMKYTSDTHSLSAILDDFWNEEKDAHK